MTIPHSLIVWSHTKENRSIRYHLPFIAATWLFSSISCIAQDSAAESRSDAPQKESTAEPQQVTPDQIPRMAPALVREHVASGQALLVCAYDSDNAFEANRLEGAISLSELKKKEPQLNRNQEIILYCA
jgi:hypothetical protein